MIEPPVPPRRPIPETEGDEVDEDGELE